MKTHIDYYQTTASSEVEELTPIAIKVLAIRSAFLDHLDTLAPPFSEWIKGHYLDRLIRAEDRHMLGEYAPFLLADILRIPSEVASRIIVPWLALYEHALLIDDIVDVRAESWSREILLSQILFDDFLSLWRERFAAHPELWSAFCVYHQQGLAAALEQMDQSLTTTEQRSLNLKWKPEMHVTMGRKAALVKFCGAALSVEHKGRLLSHSEEDGIDKLCAGIQLLDDLSDCAEDYRDGRETFPLRTAFERIGYSYYLDRSIPHPLSEDEIISVITLSGVSAEVTTLVCYYLTDGLETLNAGPDSTTVKYLMSLLDDCRRARESFDRFFEKHNQTIEAVLLSARETKEQLGQILMNPAYAALRVEMKTRFKGIPKASN